MSDRTMIETEIVSGPLKVAAGARTPGGGAVCSFLGRTRPEIHAERGPLLALHYDAARPLADRLLESLANDIAERHGLGHLAIRHAVGVVPVGAISVEIVAASDHRDAAFAACREAIDRTKAEIPIWKRECWQDGTSWSTAATPLRTDAEVVR